MTRVGKQPEFIWESYSFFVWQYSRADTAGWVCEVCQYGAGGGVFHYWNHRDRRWQKLDSYGSAFSFESPHALLPAGVWCDTRAEAEAVIEEHQALVALTALGSL